MFDSALLTVLSNKKTLTAILNTYTPSGGSARPAIFGDVAPPDAEFIYLTFCIKKTPIDVTVDQFTVDINIFDRGTSKKKIEAAAFIVEEILDHQELTHPLFDKIRLFRSSGGTLPDATGGNDQRDLRYNLIFTARAARSGWMATL